MSTPNNKKAHRKTWRRWLFITLIVASVVYLSLKTAGFLDEAEMALGRKPLTVDPSLDELLVNKQEWTPPEDGMLRQAQIHVVLRIATAIDSLEATGVSAKRQRREIASVMNEHMFTKSAYAWSRDQIVRLAFSKPITAADSLNKRRYRMFIPRIRDVQLVFRDSLDRELLN